MWKIFSEPEPSRDLKRRIEELEEENRRIDKALKDLELDWSEWYNKFRLLYARLTKRVRDEEKRQENEEPQPMLERSSTPRNGNHLDELVHERLSRPKGPSRNY